MSDSDGGGPAVQQAPTLKMRDEVLKQILASGFNEEHRIAPEALSLTSSLVRAFCRRICGLASARLRVQTSRRGVGSQCVSPVSRPCAPPFSPVSVPATPTT